MDIKYTNCALNTDPEVDFHAIPVKLLALS